MPHLQMHALAPNYDTLPTDKSVSILFFTMLPTMPLSAREIDDDHNETRVNVCKPLSTSEMFTSCQRGKAG